MGKHQPAALDMSLRMEANAIIGRLVDVKGEFFDAASARRLIDIIPVLPSSSFSIRVTSLGKSEGFTGFSPGVGNVSVGGGRSKRKSLLDMALTMYVELVCIKLDILLGGWV